MKVVSFNVNSVRQRQHQLEALIERHEPDVIGLQETKVVDDDFPLADIESLGYHVEFFGQKTHYGVALMSKTPMSNVVKGFQTDEDDAQRRLIGATVTARDGTEMQVFNGYFPQGESVKNERKFSGKRDFYADLLELCQATLDPAQPLIVMGDFNVAPVDFDIGIGPDSHKRWLRDGKASFLPEEREWLQRLFDWGLVDTYRQLYPDSMELFSWFDYRSRGFEREPKRGLRIDHVLASTPLAARLTGASIDYDIRAMEKPSDHCPVWASFD